MVLEPRASTENCPHAETEILRSDGDAEFARCPGWSQVVVFQSGRAWTVRRAQGRTIAIR